jgi:hypothetical protein
MSTKDLLNFKETDETLIKVAELFCGIAGTDIGSGGM